MSTKLSCFLSLVLVLAASFAHAFEINPNHDPKAIQRSLKSEYQRYLSRLSSPTHEQLTQLSLECAEARTKMRWCDLDPADLSQVEKFGPDALTFGVRWNDDPNNFFRVHQEVTWLFWLKSASISPSSITRVFPLEYRSHYGDMQFLHGMGRGKQDAADIHRDVVDWARFAYDVATGQVAPSATLSSLETSYPFARNFAGTSKRNWTVRKLFTNVGDVVCALCPKLETSDEEVRGLALGALLHTLQDSFSHSHVERTQGGVTAWLDYAQQDPECHGRADKDIVWIKDETIESKPAISWGAWVIRNAMLKVRWDDGVEQKFTKELFALDKPRKPDDGGFRKGRAACESA
jgi:hypothetical protein